MTREELEKIGIDLSLLEDKKQKLQEFVKKTFNALYKEKLLSDALIKNLKDSEYCNAEFGIGKIPLISEEIPEGHKNHYWKEKIFDDKYYLCAQWYNFTITGTDRAKIQRQKIKNWLLNLNNQEQSSVLDGTSSLDIYSSFLQINKQEGSKQAWSDMYEVFKQEKKDYWTRTAYFWAFIIPVYAAYSNFLENGWMGVLLSFLGSIVTFCWYKANKEMKKKLYESFAYIQDNNLGEFYRKIEESFFSTIEINKFISLAFAIASIVPVIWAIWQIIIK